MYCGPTWAMTTGGGGRRRRRRLRYEKQNLAQGARKNQKIKTGILRKTFQH